MVPGRTTHSRPRAVHEAADGATPAWSVTVWPFRAEQPAVPVDHGLPVLVVVDANHSPAKVLETLGGTVIAQFWAASSWCGPSTKTATGLPGRW